MKLKTGVIISEVDDQIVAVDASNSIERFNGMIRMNKTAGFIAQQIEKGKELEDIVKAVTDKYEVSETDARKNVCRVIDTFQDKGLLV